MKRSTEYEQLVAQIVSELESSAVVKWNDHVVGSLSGVRRQIDVSIRREDPTFLGIIDTKDYKRPATIERIDALAGVMEDVQAHYGALVCSGGFARTIHQYARRRGISLFSAHDTRSANWSLELQIPILWTELTPLVSIRSRAHFEAGDTLVIGDDGMVRLTADHAKTLVDPIGTFAQRWNDGLLPRAVGVEHVVKSEQPLEALVLDAAEQRTLRPIDEFEIAYTVRLDAWLGRFDPPECRGLLDHLDDEAFLASYLPEQSLPTERGSSWERVENPEKLAICPRGTIVLTAAPVIVSDAKMETISLQYLGP